VLGCLDYLTPDGAVLAAMGGPDAGLFLARAPGRAWIEVVGAILGRGRDKPR
jgi:hypothetical protein